MRPIVWLFLLVLLAGCSTAPATDRDLSSTNTGNAAPVSTGGDAPVSTGAVIPASSEPAASGDLEEASAASASKLTAELGAPLAVTQEGVTQLHLIDLSTGLDAPGRAPITLPAEAEISASITSADKSLLAVVSGEGQACQAYAGGSACYPEADNLHLLDLAAWKMTSVPLAGGGSVVHLAFSPDGTRLALAYNAAAKSTLQVFETATAREIAQRTLAYQPELLAYVLGGKSLAAYGAPLGDEPGITQPKAPRLELLSSDDLNPQSEWVLDGLLSGDWCVDNCSAAHDERSSVLWQPGVALSPEGSRVYIVHADEEMLTTLDMAQSAVYNTPIQSATSWLERLMRLTAGVAYAKGPLNGAMLTAAISSDGTRLYVLANRFDVGPESVEEERTLQVIDPDSGALLASRELSQNRYMHALEPSPDGKQLSLFGYAGERPLVEVVSTESLKSHNVLVGWEIASAAGSLLGKRTLPSGSELAVIDQVTLEVLRSWQVEGEASWLPGL